MPDRIQHNIGRHEPDSLGPISLAKLICSECEVSSIFCIILALFFVILPLKNTLQRPTKCNQSYFHRLHSLYIYEYSSPIKKVAVNDAYNQYTSLMSEGNTLNVVFFLKKELN